MTYTSASMSSNMARITLPLPWRGSFADDCTLAGRDFRRAVGGVVVIHVNVGARQCCLEITHYLADGDFLVIARQQYGNGGACILLEHVEHYSLCCGRSEASCGFNYDCCLLGKGYEKMA